MSASETHTARATRLVARARIVETWRPYWTLSLYPDASEAGGCLRVPQGSGGAYRSTDSERAAVEAARRARTKIRRYCAANRLNRLGDLTYAGVGCYEPRELRRDVGDFFRKLRRELGTKAMPYVWVPEWHPGGHGLHVHFAAGRFIKQSLIRDAWGNGHVYIKLLGDLPVGSGALEEARVSARYLAKYVGKAFEEKCETGLHRYEVAQGFQPERVTFKGRTNEDVIEQASERMGSAPEIVWNSSEAEGWRGPPACWVAWGD